MYTMAKPFFCRELKTNHSLPKLIAIMFIEPSVVVTSLRLQRQFDVIRQNQPWSKTPVASTACRSDNAHAPDAGNEHRPRDNEWPPLNQFTLTSPVRTK